MKWLAFICFCLLLNSGLTQVDISKDTMIQNVINELPEGWSAKVTSDVLRFEYYQDVHIMHGNWINAHDEVWKLKSDSSWIVKNGRPCKAYIDYSIQSVSTSAKAPNKTHQSDMHILSFKSYSSCLSSYEAQYNAIWPKETEHFMYSLPRLLDKHLYQVKID